MNIVSKQAGLSKIYTKHCLRVKSITDISSMKPDISCTYLAISLKVLKEVTWLILMTRKSQTWQVDFGGSN